LWVAAATRDYTKPLNRLVALGTLRKFQAKCLFVMWQSGVDGAELGVEHLVVFGSLLIELFKPALQVFNALL
jgi:hypothetical protein